MGGLLSLIGQAVGLPDDEPNPDIRVTARRPVDAADASPIPLGNRSFVEEAADASAKYPERKGRLFGAKGTLRDVLGTIGDAFLVQSGNKAVYGPRRDQERASDAMSGFTQNPLAAIERLAYENPEMAAQVYNDYMSNQAKQAQVQSVSDNRNSLASDRAYKQKQDFGNYAARLLAKADTPERQAAAMRVINTRAQALGIDPEELGISQEMSDDERSVLGAGDMTVNQQETLPIRKYQAETGRISATRPRAPQRPTNPTDASMAQPLIQKMGRVGWKGLTPNEQEQLRSLGRSPDRRKKSKKVDIGSLPLPPGFSGAKIKKTN